ncbi:2-oxoglutarate dehydrogenase E1 component [Oleisolibacter albus]|uniref:2-oxoglutarate dehydrogenase E1 component n=1 Tax=Oleisolibacter albus TaxID=2171757 RepID=UPI000DF3B907|nr:2-oxoglutarate dehydrogenase E1 component [Oleisolibacter albus]
MTQTPISTLPAEDLAWLENLRARYLRDPASVDASWQAVFAEMDAAGETVVSGPSWGRSDWPQVAKGDLVFALDGNWPAVEAPARQKPAANGAVPSFEQLAAAAHDSVRVAKLIRAYRTHGHLLADLDPLSLAAPRDHADLHPETYGFGPADHDRKMFVGGALGFDTATLGEVLARLRSLYCRALGFEFMHIADPQEKAWLQARIENPVRLDRPSAEERRGIFATLVRAEGFEKFLDLKYPGTKRFGLDGGETLIPALEEIICTAAGLGVKEVVIGMPHRGRLNVLTQVMGKPHRAIFHEFAGGSFKPDGIEGSGDVKYHLGASMDRSIGDANVHLSLSPNPSHLEVVDPVVLGRSRAKQDMLADTLIADDMPAEKRAAVLPVLMHGDAAFAGQGIVAECFGLSGLRSFTVAGSVHVVVNNQIGFTTNPYCSRSSAYPSDVAKVVEAPVFHVNGDDPEAVVFAARLAIEFRQTFHKPVVIDLVCYRRFGHNEGDEPSFTQPLMYRKIRSQQTTLELYAARLEAEGVIGAGEFEAARAAFKEKLSADFDAVKSFKPNKADWLEGRWAGLKAVPSDSMGEARRGVTGVAAGRLREIGQRLTAVPEGFQLHKTVARMLDNKRQMIETGAGIDWATGEALAFGSLLDEGQSIRLSGQDCERGTFSHRHAVLTDQETEARHIPLKHIRPGQARFEVINSMLSEEAVLGFEYGYSLAEPGALTLWEAQFGDFANGAQAMFDQFISGGERKWLRMSGLVCLLPHGYEGQGPEHSSARLERYLQLCGEDNMQVANCTTPANYFHILRRQLKRDFRKPLILMTPKSLLRHKRCVSQLAEFAEGTSFHRLLDDDAARRSGEVIRLVPDEKIRRVVLCSGKVYYDLYEEREKRGIDDVYLLRAEQLYPFPLEPLTQELKRFRNADLVWCQEEPKNMGAWTFVQPHLEEALARAGAKAGRPAYAGRPASASTAAGTMSAHQAQLRAFLEAAFAA